jgi:hypothetical protein
VKSGRAVNVPDSDDAMRIASFFGMHIGWPAFWDKRHGVWRAPPKTIPAQICTLMLIGALAKEWSYFLLPDGGKVVYCFLEKP